MQKIVLNKAFSLRPKMLYAGDYEVIGPDPALGHDEVAALGADLILIHYHHRHEFVGGGNKGLWGTVCRKGNKPDWGELDRVVDNANKKFSLVGLYPIGWAHMVPRHLGETVLDVDPEVVSDWVADVVARYQNRIDVFPIFYEMNVFDLFFRATHGHGYGRREKYHILRCLSRSVEKIAERCGDQGVSKLTAGTFVELTRSSFYWMSEGKLLELPQGSALLEAPLSPPDLLQTAGDLDAAETSDRHLPAIRQLLHHFIFWNADDSGANNTVGDDLYRLYRANLLRDSTRNAQGPIHTVIAGWDAQPQNTYEYLLRKLAPTLQVPSSAECLERNFASLTEWITDVTIPEEVRSSVVGFILDDIFKCTKQSGVTSAVYPSERLDANGVRVGAAPLTVSDIGLMYRSITGHELPSRRICSR